MILAHPRRCPGWRLRSGVLGPGLTCELADGLPVVLRIDLSTGSQELSRHPPVSVGLIFPSWTRVGVHSSDGQRVRATPQP